MHRPNLPILFVSLIFLALAHLFSLANAQATSTDAASIANISQTLSLFAHLVDGKQYSQLDLIFTPDAAANFSLPGQPVLHGLPAITRELQLLENVTSQHSISTTYVTLRSESAAEASSYLVGSFFGEEEVFTEYGTYDTDMILTNEGWRVKMLTLTQTGSSGNESIVFPGGNP